MDLLPDEADALDRLRACLGESQAPPAERWGWCEPCRAHVNLTMGADLFRVCPMHHTICPHRPKGWRPPGQMVRTTG